MPTLILTGRNVSLSSSWTYRYDNYGVPTYSTPTTAYDSITFSLSALPAGAEIKSASVSAARWGSGRIRTMNGVDSDKVTINVSTIDREKGITVNFAYQANGGSKPPDTSSSGTVTNTAGWNNPTLTLEYEMPYTAPTAPTQVTVSKATAKPGESVILSWSGAKAGNNVPVSGYQVYRSSAADGEYALLDTVDADTLQLSVTAPTTAGSYFFKVKTLGGVTGYDSNLSSAYAQASVSVTAPLPTQVLSVSPATMYPGGESTLSFSHAEPGNNNPIRGYALWMADQQDGPYELIDTINSTAASGSFPIYAPDVGSRYYKVQTLGQYMDSALSETAVIVADLSGTSDFSLSADTVDAGTAVTLTLLSNTNKAHTLTASIGEFSATQESAAGASAITFTPPLSWLSAMPDSEKWPMLLTLRTAGAGTIRREVFLRCPDNVGPTVAGAYAVRIDNDVPASWGVYVQGKSQAEIHLEQAAAMAYGSPIVSYRMEGAGGTAESADVPFSMVTSVLNAGEIPITVTATDMRGRTGTQVITMPVEAYQPPALRGILTQRCDVSGEVQDEGEYALADAEEIIYSCGGHNTGETYVSFKPQGGDDWIAGGYLENGQLVFGGGQMDIGKNYEVMYQVSDLLLGSAAYYDVITRAKPELHIRRGGGAWAFGGLADKQGALKVYGDLIMTGNLIASAEMAGRLLYVNDSGVFQPLTLGEGMYIADGVLQLGTPPGEGTPLSQLTPGTLVYLMENALTPYLVLAHDQHGSGLTTLIRYRASGTNSSFHSSTPSYSWDHKYSNSKLNTAYANYYSALPADTQGKLESVAIPVRESASSSTIVTVSAHMFALSEMEYLGSGSAEGSHIGYFADNASRIAYAEDGTTAKMIWTRSVTGGMPEYSRYMNASGGIGNNAVGVGMALRPACCVKSDALVTKEDGKYIL